MDGKKKRNRKKKGNQGKNTGDATTNAEEAVPQSNNHDSAPKENDSGADADDAMSSVGDGVPQYQNHEQTSHANQNVENVDEAISSVGEVIPREENHEPTMTQENNKASNTVYADQRSIVMSDSTVELDKDRLYEAKLDKLHDTIKQLEDEKSLCLQKVTSFKERLTGLEEINKALQDQVKVLDESSKTTVEENQRLVTSVDELQSSLQILEAKIALTEASVSKQVLENEVMDQTDLAGSPLHKQTAGFTTMISKGNELIADRGLNSSLIVTSDNIYGHVSNIPASAYASNHPDETLVNFPEATSSNVAGQSLIDVSAHQGFDETRMNGEIVPVPLDDIQIHEVDPQPPGSDFESAEVPFTDAPIVGAPFRLISFVARYVSGADLVNQK